jgi:hypothetical protein
MLVGRQRDALYFESAYTLWLMEPKRTFWHAVQTAQITSLRDADPQIVMLPTEGVRQKVRERLRILHGLYARVEGLSPPRHLDIRHWYWSWKVNARFSYRRIRRNASWSYCAYRRPESGFATRWRTPQCRRRRPDPSHVHHYEELEVKNPRRTSGLANMGYIARVESDD